MQNEDILSTLTLLYSVARRLDQAGRGASSIGVEGWKGEDLIKFNLLNILLYACSCSNENELDMSVISDIAGTDVSYQDCLDEVQSSGISSSILTEIPLSFCMLATEDNANSVILQGNGGEEKSYTYTLILLYQLIFTRLYRNCSFEELKQKNNALYNFLLELSAIVHDNLQTQACFNPGTGNIESPNFSINPSTGEIQIGTPSSGRRSRSTANNARTTRSAQERTPPRRSEPPPLPPSNPTFLSRICSYFKRLFGRS